MNLDTGTPLVIQIAMLVLAANLLTAGVCDGDDGGDTGTDATADAPYDEGDGPSGELQWYLTCGDPVCGGHRDQPGIEPCAEQKEGDPCSVADERCDPVNDCNALLVCTDTDPTAGPGGCPISSRRYKRDIAYLDAADRDALYRDVLSIDLATYHYLAEPDSARPHLGFIIEDVGDAPSVDGSGEHVDLYGYTSMAVAAIQAQAREIEALHQELDALRKELAAARAEASARSAPAP